MTQRYRGGRPAAEGPIKSKSIRVMIKPEFHQALNNMIDHQGGTISALVRKLLEEEMTKYHKRVVREDTKTANAPTEPATMNASMEADNDESDG